MTFCPVLVLPAVLSVHRGLGFGRTGAAAPPLPIAVSSFSPPPFAISLGTVCDHPIPLFRRTVGVVVAMHSFFSPSSDVIPLLLGGATVVVVAVTLPSIAAVASLPSPVSRLSAVAVVFSAPAVVGVVPAAPAIASISVLPVPVTVAVMPPRVGVMPGLPSFLLPSFWKSAWFVSVSGLYHQWTVQVSLHIGMQVKGRGHSAPFLRVELVEQGLAARPHVVSPQLIGSLLPNGHGLCGPLLLLTAHRNQIHRKQPCDNKITSESSSLMLVLYSGWGLAEDYHP